MANFTLTFAGKTIKSFNFKPGTTVQIGANDSNSIRIDSTSVAPVHAAIDLDAHNGITIKQADPKFPLVVNGKPCTEQLLSHGDCIYLGKHALHYSQDPAVTDPIASAKTGKMKASRSQPRQTVKPATANLQVLNGNHIGRIIPLKQALTPLGKSLTGIVVITKRKDGYFVSQLKGEQVASVNDRPLGQNSVMLSHGDRLEINKTAMQFLIDL